MLIDIAQALDRFGSFAYVRPYAEMNGHWNPYSAYNSNGSYRGAAHSTKNFRRAFRRTYLIVHGGSVADINAKLVDSGMPKLDRTNDLPLNDVKVIWNPQGFGSPDLKANSADSYYPGDKYVDVVANDLYDFGRGVEWEANLDLYRGHPDKPYAIGEWGLGPGNRPPGLRPEDGQLRLQPPAGRDDHLLPQPERLDVRPQLQAEVYARLQALHPAAG